MSFLGVRWLFLDLGGTLIDETGTEDYRAGQIRRLVYERGFDLSIGSIKQLVEQSTASHVHDIIAGTIEKIIGDPVEAAVLSKEIGYIHDYESPYPGAAAILSLLSSRYQIGIIANQRMGTEERLKRYGLLNNISFIVSSAEAGVSKPDPAIFKLGLEKVGCRPLESVLVGDRLDNDIKPAKQVGMRTIRVLQGYHRLASPRDDSEEPDYTINSIDELPGILL